MNFFELFSERKIVSIRGNNIFSIVTLMVLFKALNELTQLEMSPNPIDNTF